MTVVTIEPATLADLSWITANLRPIDRAELLATRFGDDTLAVAVNCLRLSRWAWTVQADGQPVAGIGAAEMWPGVCQCWMYGTARFGEVAVTLTRFVRRRMIPRLKAEGMHRGQCHVIAGYPQAERWVMACGAKLECTLHRYGRGGEDHRVYVWFKE